MPGAAGCAVHTPPAYRLFARLHFSGLPLLAGILIIPVTISVTVAVITVAIITVPVAVTVAIITVPVSVPVTVPVSVTIAVAVAVAVIIMVSVMVMVGVIITTLEAGIVIRTFIGPCTRALFTALGGMSLQG